MIDLFYTIIRTLQVNPYQIYGGLVVLFIWLIPLYIAMITAFRKYFAETNQNLKKQYFFIGFTFLTLAIGDVFHGLGMYLQLATNNKLAPVQLFGSTIYIEPISLIFDSVMVTLFYMFWQFFMVWRYQNEKLLNIDYVLLLMAFIRLVMIFMPYNWWGLTPPPGELNLRPIHNTFFILFGLIVVIRTMLYSRDAKKVSEDPVIQKQEYAIFLTGFCFIISFLFYTLTIALIPINPAAGMLMIPKTFAYIAAIIIIYKDILR